jgi:acetyl-CoA hydrolase
MVPGALVTVTIDAEGPLPLPPEKEKREPLMSDDHLAANVAALIPDGAYVQVGVGSTAQALVRGLAGHHDLRLHTGLINSEIQDLLESPAVDQTWLPRFGQALGPKSLMRYVDHNKRLSFHSTRYIHDVARLVGYGRFFSINSTLEVDLFGRASSEGSVRRPSAGLGGVIDFMIAGRVASEGANIIALRSMSGSGESRIVPILKSSEVSVPSYLIDYVVTDWGVADLRAATRRECAERIIAIAHPKHRGYLDDSFRTMMTRGEVVL